MSDMRLITSQYCTRRGGTPQEKSLSDREGWPEGNPFYVGNLFKAAF